MKAINRIVTTGLLVSLLAIGSTMAKGGVIVNLTRESQIKQCVSTSPSATVSNLSKGVIVNLTGVIVNFTGVIVNFTGVIVNFADATRSSCGHIPTDV